MSQTVTISTIQLKRASAATWTSLNPILLPGELGLEKDTNSLKVGDGVTAWVSLDYIAGEETPVTSNLYKDGYRWIKGSGNNNLSQYEVGDEGIGVGTLFPGYVVHFYVKNEPMENEETDLVILSSTPL
jgi:hypothetical protein